MSDTKLLPCPWTRPADHLRGEHHQTDVVGGGAYIDSDPQYVQCSCGAQGPTDYSEEGAVAAWNARPAPALTPKQEAAEELFEALTDALGLMNHMGDTLNGMDAVTSTDMARARPVFDAVRAALAKAGRP